ISQPKTINILILICLVSWAPFTSTPKSRLAAPRKRQPSWFRISLDNSLDLLNIIPTFNRAHPENLRINISHPETITANGSFRSVWLYRPPSPIISTEPLPPLPRILSGLLAIVKVQAPIRRYGMALDLLHGLQTAATALYDLHLGSDRRQP
ncbi:MAG: hypothetical protein WBI23_03910, partial [Methanothrix sp.]